MIAQQQKTGEEKFRQWRREARSRVVQFLYQIDAGKDTELTDETIALFWKQNADNDEPDEQQLAPAVRKLAERLVNGVIEHKDELDEVINACARNWRTERMSVIDRNIMRLAAYEIIFCLDIPPKATVNEAVELAKKYGDKDSPRFVNGILDKLLHEQPEQ